MKYQNILFGKSKKRSCRLLNLPRDRKYFRLQAYSKYSTYMLSEDSASAQSVRGLLFQFTQFLEIEYRWPESLCSNCKEPSFHS